MQDDFYDQELDDLDQEFMESIQTDSLILSCPMCFTVVCRDCQQHIKYKNQYRAMFVLNCTVIQDQVLKAEDQVFNPVRCSECTCEIGVYDQEQVYHFYRVIAE